MEYHREDQLETTFNEPSMELMTVLETAWDTEQSMKTNLIPSVNQYAASKMKRLLIENCPTE